MNNIGSLWEKHPDQRSHRRIDLMILGAYMIILRRQAGIASFDPGGSLMKKWLGYLEECNSGGLINPPELFFLFIIDIFLFLP